MQKIYRLVFLFSFLICIKGISQQHYILAKSGLNMREAANLSSKKITKIPLGEKVTTFPTPATQSFMVDGINGSWVKIKYKHYEGYVFSGFLSKYYPTGVSDFESFLEDKTNELSIRKSVTGGQTEEDEKTTSYTIKDIKLSELFLIAQLTNAYFVNQEDSLSDKDFTGMDAYKEFDLTKTLKRDKNQNVILYSKTHHVTGFSIEQVQDTCIVSFYSFGPG